MNIVSLKKLNHSKQPGPLSLIPLLKQTDNKILIGADHYSHLTELLSVKNEQIVKPDTICFTTPSAFAIISFISPMIESSGLIEAINKSILGSALYNNNLLLNIIL